MQNPRERMEAELKTAVLPVLRSMGFKGSFPHFRKKTETGIDLLTFQFDRYGGGVIEIGHCGSEGVVTHWGKAVPPGKVTAWDLHPNQRKEFRLFLGPERMHGSAMMKGSIPLAVPRC